MIEARLREGEQGVWGRPACQPWGGGGVGRGRFGERR